MQNHFEYERRKAKQPFFNGRRNEASNKQQKNRPYVFPCTSNSPIDMESYNSNISKLFELVKDFASTESIRSLCILTFQTRRQLILKEVLSKDSILKTMCPVLNQVDYVSYILFQFFTSLSNSFYIA